MLKEKNFSIIIPVYNNENIILRCLASLYSQQNITKEIIVVDDCSTDNSVRILQEEAAENNFRLLINEKKMGYAGSCSVAADQAEGEIIIFLNSDAFLSDNNQLSRIYESFKRENNIGVMGFYQVNLDFSPQFIGSKIDIFLNLNHNTEVARADSLKLDVLLEENIFMTGGACYAVYSDVYRRAGGIDPSYFLYVEELDLMWRIRLLGYRVVTNIREQILHIGGASTNTGRHSTSIEKIFYRERNSLTTMIKNYSLLSLIWILPLYLFFQLLEMIVLVFMGRLEVCRAYIWSIIYIKNNFRAILIKRRLVQRYRIISDFFLFRKKLIIFTFYKIGYILKYGIPQIK
ncbi:MAG: glycosyltransferase [Patescibacteria group bacterium]